MPHLLEQVRLLLARPRPLPLVFAGDPVLRRPAEPYDFSLPDEVWAELLDSMRHTMHEAPGVGLAAPQVGLGVRVAVIEDPATVRPDIAEERDRYPTPPRVLVNPTYRPVSTGDAQEAAFYEGCLSVPGYAARPVSTGDAQEAAFYEGCLSVPGYAAVVPRATAVRLTCQDEQGRDVDEVVTGWAARIVAHETDHLHGTLYLDRALTRSLTTTRNLVDVWGDSAIPLIRQELDF